MIISIRHITIADKAAYDKVFDLREEILRQPIGLSLKNEDLSADNEDIIVIGEAGGEIVGCLMIHPTADAKIVKLRQMAVAASQQGTGIGKQLMNAAEDLIWAGTAEKIVLHARVTAEDFYKRLNYTTTSGVFTEVGIPHVVMEKERKDAL